MDGDRAKTGFWTRVVADEAFREAVLADPLRAVAAVDDVEVSGTQIAVLEEMDEDERRELVMNVVRDAYLAASWARFGPLREDGAPGPQPPDGAAPPEVGDT